MCAEKRERLHGFTKTHLVGEDAAEIVRRESRQPVEPGELILAQYLSASGPSFVFASGDASRPVMNFFSASRRSATAEPSSRAVSSTYAGVGAVDAVKPGLSLRRIAVADDLLEILQAGGVDHREVAIL